MNIEKTFQGAWRISTVIGNQYFHRQYMGYTKKEAVRLFKEYLKGEIS